MTAIRWPGVLVFLAVLFALVAFFGMSPDLAVQQKLLHDLDTFFALVVGGTAGVVVAWKLSRSVADPATKLTVPMVVVFVGLLAAITLLRALATDPQIVGVLFQRLDALVAFVIAALGGGAAGYALGIRHEKDMRNAAEPLNPSWPVAIAVIGIVGALVAFYWMSTDDERAQILAHFDVLVATIVGALGGAGGAYTLGRTRAAATATTVVVVTAPPAGSPIKK